jgi:Ca-activated chloride channel family protein
MGGGTKMSERRWGWRRAGLAFFVTAGLLAQACSSGGDDDTSGGADLADPGDCTAVDIAVSSEKTELLGDLADSFNGSDDAQVGDGCAFVRVSTKASGRAEQLLANGWDEEAEGKRPVIWSPASSTWASVLNQHLADASKDPIANEFTPFMLTPLVIAMPKKMAEALGWPNEPLGFADILALARDGQGWASHGHPEWGQFRLGKTNPNFSTSGLSALIAQAYAATGKTSGLSQEDLNRPEVGQFAAGVESAVVHYGDTTLTFLNNWYRADQRGNPFQYVSAVAVEEKSVIDYNTGNPDGVLDPGEEPRPPREPLVAIYPEEGTLYSDNPLITLDAEWVNQKEKDAAAAFVDYVQTTANQKKVLRYGFRPAIPDVPVGKPIEEANGVNPAPPQTLLEVPQPEVLTKLLADWATQRKSAKVLLVIDVSGSMGDEADPDTGETKLDLAKRAAIQALDQFKDDDEVGLWVFSTNLDGPDPMVQELVPTSRVGDVREQLRSQIGDLSPRENTPLYDVTERAYQQALDTYDPTRINAVVLLSDGENNDGDNTDDREQFDDLIDTLDDSLEGGTAQVRVFPVAYGREADMGTLRQIAEATSAAAYDASDPTSIERVFFNVISNF